jgi:hypothetical protein
VSRADLGQLRERGQLVARLDRLLPQLHHVDAAGQRRVGELREVRSQARAQVQPRVREAPADGRSVESRHALTLSGALPWKVVRTGVRRYRAERGSADPDRRT